MIDSKTGDRVVVLIHSEFGPFIKIPVGPDAVALEELLNKTYYVLYLVGSPGGQVDEGWQEYYFGDLADPIKLQSILDLIVC